ncbi:transglutaminase-like cysteine peptidase [Maritalea porphyrae]|uniref:transglutaminase-like cysteine peptidase n=1 Tax=Maritalea porphyrae TaxID=880732 RepID=UPI0022B007DC|nr:transglutaminase-like cysteine peptidase [Maritalea porphyrae]MCZ4273352.1 transglutaminase-like cysteine peptidase [Maritalea porphyrae]
MLRSALVIILLTVCSWLPSTTALAMNFDNPAFAPAGTATSIPIGHVEFCQTRPAECVKNSIEVQAVTLNQDNWSQLLEINKKYNAEIRPITDQDLYRVAEFWTYPNGAGDCEDYVLAKRRALIDAGWPKSTLLITVVRQANGAGHAVLMVRTDRGDLVLDNQDGLILRWSETPYTYIKRQSQAHAGIWVELFDDASNGLRGTASASVGSTNR